MSGLSGADLIQESLIVKGDYVHGDKMGGDKVFGNKYEIQSALPRYFHFCIIDPENDHLQVTHLDPDKQYRVEVWTETNPNANHVTISDQFSISLLLKVQETDVAQHITIPDPQIFIPAGQFLNFEHQFDLITDSKLPHGQIDLSLQFWPENKQYREKTAVSQQIQLAGVVDPELFRACHIQPNAERPQHVAIIHVKYAEDNQQIQLTCWGHYGNRDICTMPFPPPKIRLADFIEARTDPQAVLGEMVAFSDDTANIKILHQGTAGYKEGLTIVGWLKAVHNRHNEALQLIIVDHTDTEIPWEMLKLGPERYLGTLIPVVRWLLLPQGEVHRELEMSPGQCAGRVAAYLDEDSLPDAVGERQLLAHFDTHFHDNVQSLEANLRDLQPETGLVYLGCHGMFVPHDPSDKAGIAFGSQNNPSERLIPLHLEAKLADKIFPHRPVFFINASHSGRVIKPKGRLGFQGLPIVLLKRIAASYVGTLGPVGSSFASQIGRYVLETIRNSENGESLAELLRQLRTMAAEQLAADIDSTSNQLRFIYTFMYVYYGNPLLKLSLHPAPEPEGGSDV